MELVAHTIKLSCKKKCDICKFDRFSAISLADLVTEHTHTKTNTHKVVKPLVNKHETRFNEIHFHTYVVGDGVVPKTKRNLQLL